MKVELRRLPKSEIELKIEVSVEEWHEFLDTAAKELSKGIKIKGFRPGSAPLKIVEEKIGTTKILTEAAEHCVQKCYVKAILENEIEAIGQPDVSILKLAKSNPFEFKARVVVTPEVKLPDYKKIASGVKKNKVLAGEKEIEESLFWLQKSRARFSQKSGPCQSGDWVEIKLKIKNQKSKIPEPEIRDGFILGQGKLIPGLEEKIEGMSAGEEKEFLLTFPENHHQKELAGKKADFEIKLESVQKMELPEINDAFVRGLGDFKDLPALKKNLREGINLEKETLESQRVRQEILAKLSDKSELEIPEILLDNVKSQMLADLKQNVSQKLGITFEEYLNRINKTGKELLDSFSAEAQKRVKNSLVLREISKREKIAVSVEEHPFFSTLRSALVDEEAGTEANKVLKNYPNNQKVDPERLKDYTKDVIRNEKTLQFLESFSQTQ